MYRRRRETANNNFRKHRTSTNAVSIKREQFAREKAEMALNGRVDLDERSICWESLDEGDMVKTRCKHYFHAQCLIETVNLCPMCRSLIARE